MEDDIERPAGDRSEEAQLRGQARGTGREHQIPTKYGGYIDVLGVDVEGRIHVIELKRDRTPREVVAQILDYGSWAQDLSLSEVTELYAEHQAGAGRGIRRDIRKRCT